MGRPKHTRAMAGGALEKGGKGGVFVGAKVLHHFLALSSMVPTHFKVALSCAVTVLLFEKGGGGDACISVSIYIYPLRPHLSALNISFITTEY